MTTLRDIADRAHVSTITVSRVINTPDKVKPKTRDRIEKIMRELNYTPNLAAKNLVVKRTGIIDVYIPEHIDLSNPFVMHFLAGISETLSEKMYSFLIRRNLREEHRCDGYIVTGLFKNEIGQFYSYAAERNRKVALFGHTDIPSCDCIDVDNWKGGELAADYLTDMGHRRVAIINVNEDKDYKDERQEGFFRGLTKKGIDPQNIPVICIDNSVEGGYRAAKSILRDHKVTGLYCTTDTMGIGAVQAITDSGLSVPDDLSIIGYDGLGHQFLTTPSLTTVEQPIFKIGKMLASTLIQRIEGNTETTKLFLSPKVVTGHSVAPISSTQGRKQ